MNDTSDSSADFECYPPGVAMDETDRSLRAYVGRIPHEKLRQFRRDWSDDELIAWDGNFRSDGNLMLVCCERDVEVAEFRRVIDQYFRFRESRGDPI